MTKDEIDKIDKISSWEAGTTIIGAKKIKIGEFTFDEAFVSNNPLMALMLLIVVDPSEKQKELLDKIGVVVEDDNGKKFYPREEKKEEE